jgi:hypothetical protein
MRKPPDGHQAVHAGVRDKTITTVLGSVTLRRAWYHCGQCGHGLAPRDEQLGVAGATLSPGIAEMLALAGSEVSFARAAGLIGGLAGITVSARAIERSAEATGAAARTRPPRSAPASSSQCPRRNHCPTCCMPRSTGTGVPVRPSETEGRAGTAKMFRI